MKPHKRVVVFLLACLMSLSALPAAAQAASAGFSNFRKVNEYTSETFTDVAAGKWYEESVQIAYELNLVKGSSAVTFSPDGKITIGAALALACRLHSIYHTGSAEFVQGTPWYAVYVDYAVDNGIITRGQFSDFNVNATRREFAVIFSKALPTEALEQFNTVEDGMIPDLAAGTAGYDDIYALYRAGILTGNDKKGTFAPETTIDRASVAAITARMAIPALRKGITLKAVPVTGVTLSESSLTLTAGDCRTITAAVLPADASNRTLSWKSTDPSVAAVNNGTITAVSAGSAVITCTAVGGIEASCSVNVLSAPVSATGLTMSRTSAEISVGDTLRLDVSLQPSNANTNHQVTWSSSNNRVSVASDGTVTGQNVGTATVYAKLPNGETASCRVTVKKASVRIVLRDSLPKTLYEYDYRNRIESSCTVTDFRYEVSDYTHSVEQTAYLYFSGTKNYDENGAGQSASCKISWKLYDADGYVVDSSTCRSAGVAVGEKFRDAKDYCFDLMPGTYYLELSNTN